MKTHGTLVTFRDKFFKEKTISRRIWSMVVLMSCIVAVQILLVIALPRVIFNQERSIIDSLEPVVTTSTDVRHDVLSMIGGAAQWGLTGESFRPGALPRRSRLPAQRHHDAEDGRRVQSQPRSR